MGFKPELLQKNIIPNCTQLHYTVTPLPFLFSVSFGTEICRHGDDEYLTQFLIKMDKSKQQRYRENNPKHVEFSQLNCGVTL